MLPPVPSQTFTHTAFTAAGIDEVWAALDRPETWESIGGVDHVFDPRIDGDGKLRGFSFDTVAAGKRYIGEATPGRREEGTLISWNVRNSEIRGETTVALTSAGSGTSIRVTLQVESSSMLAGMFFGVIAGAIGEGLPGAVDEFAADLAEH